MTAPGAIRYSPDSKAVTFLHSESGTLVRDLWRVDLETGARVRHFSPSESATDQNVSREEALRRERQRLREMGVTHYAWAERAAVILAPVRGRLYRIENGRADPIAEGVVDPKISADGRRVFFVRESEVWCLDERGERRLTSGSSPGVTHGLAEYIAQEELGRHSGFWPSPDGGKVAFEEADERHIPVFPIVHQGKDRPIVEEHRYPFAGEANARVRLGVVCAGGGDPSWLDLGTDPDPYLARVEFHPDGRLFVQILSRDQRRLELWAYEPSGRRTRLLTEESPLWINLHHDLRFVEATGEFVWASERTGFKHLYLYGPDGRLVRPLTSGPWPVDAVVGLEEKTRMLYFAAGVDSPLERQICAVPLDGGDLRRLTSETGLHDAVIAPDGSSFVDVFDSRTRPPSVTLRRMDGSLWRELHSGPAPDLPPPELHSFTSRDGVTLHAALYRPAAARPPIVVSVYGGPHAQMVFDGWMLTVDMRAQLLAQEGFLVLKVDNRGSARRGLAFEGAIAGNMGDLELRDQIDGVRWAASQGWGDPSRVGIYGWSYGGYMSAMALVRAPDVFRVGVSGAPVTSWDGYDTAYTERYMRTPATNPEGYRSSSVMTHAAGLRGRLMLVHGMLDENVHFRHTARLVNALIRENRPCDLLVYPDERHMPRSEADRIAMETRILDYFRRHL
jgi:dipeptidyl-peptidase-4